jgi:hypothetical protein
VSAQQKIADDARATSLSLGLIRELLEGFSDDDDFEEEGAGGGGAGGGGGGGKMGRKKKKKKKKTKAGGGRKLPTGRRYNGREYGSPLVAQETWLKDDKERRGGDPTPEMRAVQERLDQRDAEARKPPTGERHNGQRFGSPLGAQEAWLKDEMNRRGGVATPEMQAVQERLDERDAKKQKKGR